MKNIFRFLLLAFQVFAAANFLRAQWVQSGADSSYVVSLAVGGTNIFAGTYDRGIFLSTNNGTSWTQVNSGLTSSSNIFKSLVISGTNIFAGSGLGVYRSTNNGSSWSTVNTGLPATYVQALAVSGTNLFAGTAVLSGGTAYGGVYLSTNNGTSWTHVNSGITSSIVYSLAVKPNGSGGTNLFAGSDSGAFLSTNNGTSWTPVNSGLTSRCVLCFAVLGANLFAGMEAINNDSGGIFCSTDNGSTWTPTGLKNGSISCLAVSGTNLFAAIGSVGVYLSTDNGTNWTQVNSGLSDFEGYAFSVAVSTPYLFAGNYNGVWRRPLSEMITSVGSSNGKKLPTRFTLEQNYPNPFNPATTISFSLPLESIVSLKVYNIIGREVATLVSEEMPAGNYSRTWNANGWPSGVYFYRIEAGTYHDTKKLLLLK